MTTRRHRTVNLVVAFVSAGACGIAIAGCNAVFDNEPGKLRTDRTATRPTEQTTNDTPDPEGASSTPITSSGSLDGGAPLEPGNACPAGQVWCQGLCVADNDPNYGCGSCVPCRSPHGTATCENHACVIQACDPGYADCNAQATDGCEADLSKPATCGGCTSVCPTDRPVCAPQAASYVCGTGCPEAAPTRCGDTCVSTTTSANHCGKCGAKCAEVDHADVACVLGQCTVACKASYHLCNAKCVLDTDATACGASCTACPAAPNAVATCQSAACGLACKPGFDNCNALANDGCETNLASDPLHCGACGRSCNGGTCNAGVCSPAPDAGP